MPIIRIVHRFASEKRSDQRVFALFQPTIWFFAAATTLAWFLTSTMPSQTEWWLLAALIILGNISDLRAIQIRRDVRISMAHFSAPFAIIIIGATGGLIAAFGCCVGRSLRARFGKEQLPRGKIPFDLAVNLAATSVSGAVWVLSSAIFPYQLFISSVLTVSSFALSRSAIEIGWSYTRRQRHRNSASEPPPVRRLMLSAALLFTPAMMFVKVDHNSVIATLLLLSMPFAATQFLAHAYRREYRLSRKLESANTNLIKSLINALDARDPYSAGHSIAVAVFSRDLALEIGLPWHEAQRVYLAGLLHDIGKIAIPDQVLRKPEALSESEIAEIREHPVIGERILEPSSAMADLLPAIRHHHERIDGHGYPDRLLDKEIPLHARIIAVADAYDSMTSDRPYRDAMPSYLAQRVLIQGQGTRHDPFLVNAFIRLLRMRGTDYAMRRCAEFATTQQLLAPLSDDDLEQTLVATIRRFAA